MSNKRTVRKDRHDTPVKSEAKDKIKAKPKKPQESPADGLDFEKSVPKSSKSGKMTALKQKKPPVTMSIDKSQINSS